MDNATQTPKVIWASAKTAYQIKHLDDYLKADNVFQQAMGKMFTLLQYAEVDKTDAIIAKLIENKKLKPQNAAQIPYPLWVELSKQYTADLRLHPDEPPLFPENLPQYRLRSSAIGWYYTQTVVVPHPALNLAKIYRDQDTFSMSLAIDFHGLPLYIPVKSKKYAGALLSTQAFLASEELEYWELFADKPSDPELTYVFTMFFTLVGIDGNPSATLCCPMFEHISSDEKLNANFREKTRSLSWLKDALSSGPHNDLDIIKSCLWAMRVAMYLHSHLPSADWLSTKKRIELKKDPQTGVVDAVVPEYSSIYILTKEGSFPLHDPIFSLEVKSDS